MARPRQSDAISLGQLWPTTVPAHALTLLADDHQEHLRVACQREPVVRPRRLSLSVGDPTHCPGRSVQVLVNLIVISVLAKRCIDLVLEPHLRVGGSEHHVDDRVAEVFPSHPLSLSSDLPVALA